MFQYLKCSKKGIMAYFKTPLQNVSRGPEKNIENPDMIAGF
jgi:hypothetical protein